MSELQAIKDGHLHISVPYSFHKDKITEIKTKKTIEQTLTEFFSEHIPLVCEVVETQQTAADDSELDKLAADFGGQVT